MEPTGMVQLTCHPTHYNTDVPDPIVIQVRTNSHHFAMFILNDC